MPGPQSLQGGGVEDLHTLIDAGKQFSVILADPPWEFKVYSGKGKQRSAERHYDTAEFEEKARLAVANCPELAIEIVED